LVLLTSEELPVTQGEAPVSGRGGIEVVGDEEHGRLSFMGDLLKEMHDVLAACAVQVPGRLIGENESRFSGECPCDRDSLALASREVLGGVLKAIL
jgi:hypothetical protein